MSIGDVVLTKMRFQDRGNRCTNLMNPVYEVNGIVVKDEPRYSKPKPLKKFIPGNHLLQTHDIEGAYNGWGKLQRREFRNILTTADVQGAQADTIKHSITSHRMTNPLAPVYPSLDGESLPPLLTPLLPKALITVPSLRPNLTVTSKSMTSPVVSARSTPVVSARDKKAVLDRLQDIEAVRSL